MSRKSKRVEEMQKAALKVEDKINNLFEKACKFDIDNKIRHLICKEFKVKTSYDKIYALKKMYSVSYCLKSDNNVKIDLEPEFLTILQDSFRLYIFYILQMHSNFFLFNCKSIVYFVCKHLCSLISSYSSIMESDKSVYLNNINGRLRSMFQIFLADSSKSVQDKTILSGHESTINILLTFLKTDLSNIDQGFELLQQIKGYPATFGASLNFVLEKCESCISGYQVKIFFNSDEIIPFFSKDPKRCDLLEFLEYSSSVISKKVDPLK